MDAGGRAAERFGPEPRGLNTVSPPPLRQATASTTRLAQRASSFILKPVTPFVTTGGAFLFTILYADLMFDLQVLGHGGRELPEGVLASISNYYRRVTVEARPLNRLVVAVMVGTLAAIVLQLAGDDVPGWVGLTSLVLAGLPILLAAVHTFPTAVRLGLRAEPLEVQSRLARSICRDHLLCLVAITSLLAVELGFGR